MATITLKPVSVSVDGGYSIPVVWCGTNKAAILAAAGSCAIAPSTGAGVPQEYYVMDSAAAIADGSTINTVTIVSQNANSGDDPDRPGAFMTVYLGVRTTGGDTNANASYGLTETYVETSLPLARPGGGSWTKADFSTVTFSVGIGHNWGVDSNTPACRKLWAVIDYTEAIGTDQVLGVF